MLVAYMADLKRPLWIHLKGFLFLVILAISAATIWIQLPRWEIAVLVLLTIWSSARLYYYLFYVIENYVDSTYKFSGISSAIRYLLLTQTSRNSSPDEDDVTP